MLAVTHVFDDMVTLAKLRRKTARVCRSKFGITMLIGMVVGLGIIKLGVYRFQVPVENDTAGKLIQDGLTTLAGAVILLFCLVEFGYSLYKARA